MKKFLFILAALALASPAKADPLPSNYIGIWCGDSGGKDISALARENDKCSDDEITIKIHAKGYALNEDDECKFISIRRTGEYTLIPLSKTTHYKIPYIRTVAHCTGEGTAWTATREFHLEQGGVMVSKLLNHKVRR